MDAIQLTPTTDVSTTRLLKPGDVSTTVNSQNLSSDDKVRKAAQSFERTLVRQMLSIVRNPSIRGDDNSTTSSGYLEMVDDNTADQLTSGKGLGFATQMAKQMISQINAKNVNGLTQNAVINPLASSRSVASK